MSTYPSFPVDLRSHPLSESQRSAMSEGEADRMVRRFVWRRRLTTGLVFASIAAVVAVAVVALADRGPSTMGQIEDAFDVGKPFVDPPMVVPVGEHPDEEDAPIAPTTDDARLPTDARPPERPDPRAEAEAPRHEAPAANDATVESEAARAHIDALPSEHEAEAEADEPVIDSETAVRGGAPLPSMNASMTPAPIPLARADDGPGAERVRNASLRRAQELLEADRPYEALLQYETAAESGRNPAAAFLGMGRAYLSIGKPEAAETQFRRALNADSDYAPAIFELAAVLQHLKRNEEATTEYRRYLALAPDAPDAEAALEAIQLLEAQPL